MPISRCLVLGLGIAGCAQFGLATPAAATDWTGAASSDWFNAGNWAAGLPNGSIDANVNIFSPHAAVIDGASAVAHNVGFNASVTIQNGGTLANGFGNVGYTAGSTGTVTVTGVGSSWSNANSLIIGSSGGTGSLSLLDGGAASAAYASIGVTAGSTGTITVDGAGSRFNDSGTLFVGQSGSGALSIHNGGLVTTAYSSIGANAGSHGSVTVDGAGSQFNDSGTLFVGQSGTGALSIHNGGHVTSAYAGLGIAAGSTGTITVDGAGSQFNDSGSLIVGQAGTGALSIHNGGLVTTAYSSIGASAGSNGSVTVDGAGSQFNDSGTLFVGQSGSGLLTVRNGASALSQDTSIGYDVGSTGAAIVDGAGSSWSITSNLSIGAFGNGALTIRNDAIVSVAGVTTVGTSAGASGTINIGAGSGESAVTPGTFETASIAFGAGGGTIVFNHTSTDYVFAADISGAGAIEVDAGTTRLTGNSTYSGATIVNGGILVVDGTAAASPFLVNSGAMLAGIGTVGDTTIASGGVLSPGHSIGTLTVNGNLTFNAGANFDIEVSSSGADRVNATGSATLDGVVNAAYSMGSYIPRRYVIVNAGGGITGTFNGLNNINLPGNITPFLNYDANNAFLDLTLNFASTPGDWLNDNQRHVADALTDYFNRTGGIPAVFAGLTPVGLTMLSGEVGSSLAQSAIIDTNMFMSAVFNSSVADRAPASGGTQGPAPTDDDGQATVTFANGWASPYGGTSHVSGQYPVGSHDMTRHTFGLALGANFPVARDASIGIAIGNETSRLALDDGLGSARADVLRAGLFGKYRFGTAYLAGLAGYGYHDMSTDRTVMFTGADALHSAFTAHSFSGRVEAGYGLTGGPLNLSPYGALQVTALRLPNYDETPTAGSNQFALNYAAHDAVSAHMELGLRVAKELALENGALSLRARGAWVHERLNGLGAPATLQALPGSTFTVIGARSPVNSALVSVGADLSFGNGWSIGANFDGQFSGSDTTLTAFGAIKSTF
jgi:T5SS/PEP-CTERM-associated repeat protein/autotransporter-associated beta strand protein